LESLDTCIAAIPFVANVAPISWAENIQVEVPVLDDQFKKSLVYIREELNRLYPEVGFGSGSSNVHIKYPQDLKRST